MESAKEITFVDSFYAITKETLFDLCTRMYMNKGLTKQESWKVLKDLGNKITNEKRNKRRQYKHQRNGSARK